MMITRTIKQLLNTIIIIMVMVKQEQEQEQEQEPEGRRRHRCTNAKAAHDHWPKAS